MERNSQLDAEHRSHHYATLPAFLEELNKGKSIKKITTLLLMREY